MLHLMKHQSSTWNLCQTRTTNGSMILTSKYINPGKIPEPFEITIDVLSGDGNALQTWEYSKCQIIDYKTIIADSLVTRMFTEQFQPEIRDRSIFECAGISLVPQSQEPLEQKTTRPLMILFLKMKTEQWHLLLSFQEENLRDHLQSTPLMI